MHYNDFLDKLINYYNEQELVLIKKGLLYASKKHDRQYRKSGEPYIIHPILVASMLVDLRADANTVCAALLHDVLEDTDTKKDEIIANFNEDVANLVDGVTKFSDDGVSSVEERKAQYIRKITTSIFSDVRVIIIKLMDRVHNMETLQYQKRAKQIKIAQETLDIYVPIAYYLGIYKIRFLLEDLSFKYLDLPRYQEIESMRNEIVIEGNSILDEMISLIKHELAKYKIDCTFEKNTKNIYGIYKRIKNGANILDIGDILRIKIITNDLIDCYHVLGVVHSLFHPINNKFKDYISNPKTNKYQAIHTTVYTNLNRLVQLQIRTKEMNDVDQYGVVNEWISGEKNADITSYLCNNFPFISVLKEINEFYQNDLEFMDKLEHDVLKEKVYIIIGNGNSFELPKGSTLNDLCLKLGIDSNRIMVNNKVEQLNYVLKSSDYISFINQKVKKK